MSPINQKMVRRRNIVPAEIGYFAFFFMCGYGSILGGLYMIPIGVGNEGEKHLEKFSPAAQVKYL